MKESARRASKVAATARTIAADKDSAVAASARAAVRATAAVSGDAVGYAVANSGYWGEVLEDARGIQKGKDIMCLPLWSDDIPIELVNGWRLGKSNLEDHESNAFWISWYEAILAGRPLTSDWHSHWQLMQDIALIAPEDWDKGAEHLAGVIEPMLLRATLPTTDKVLQTDHGTYVVQTLPLEDAQTFDTFLDMVNDRLEDCLEGHNGINDRSREARTLRRVLDKYRDNPLRIEQDFTSVAAGLRKNIDNEVLPDSDDNLALLEGVEDTVRLIRDAHPDVAQTRNQIAHLRMQDLAPEQKTLISDAKDLLVEVTEGQLKADFDVDLSELVAPNLPSVTREDRGNDPPPEALRSFARIAKMHAREVEQPLPLSKRASELVQKIDGSAGYKAARMVTTGTTLVGILATLGGLALSLLGIL